MPRRSVEIESVLAATNALLLDRMSRDRSDEECEQTAAIVREIAQIRDRMLADPLYDPSERAQALEIFLQRREATI